MRQWRAFVGSNVAGYRKRKQRARGNALLVLFGGFLAAYMISEALLVARPHPLHWIPAGVAAVLLYGISYVWLLHRSYTRHRR